MLYKMDCVCWDNIYRTCNAIEPKYFNRHGCVGCAFYKDDATYRKQTGKSYKYVMQNAKVYGRKRYDQK